VATRLKCHATVRYGVLRILVLTDWFPEQAGDATGSFVRAQALAMSPRHEVTVLHVSRMPAAGGPPRLEELVDGPLRILRLRSGRLGSTTAANLWATAATLRRLHRRGERPELLHAHEMGAGLAAVITGRALRIAVVVSEHSSTFATGDLTGVAALLPRLVFAGADLVCPVSESLRATLTAGGWGGRYRVVPNVVDIERFTPAPAPPPGAPPLILSVAGFDPVKGVQDFVEAVALLRDRGADFEAVLVGDGQLRPQLATRVQALGLGDRLTLPGVVPHADLPALMHRAAFLVVPSRWETFSVVLSEAMACGVPVVATAVGALQERVRSETGMLCQPQDPEAMATTMAAMLGSYRDYDRAAIAAGVRDRYSATAIADRWEEVYAEALACHPRRPISSVKGSQ
jgi:glycosyltransferase involved in cell wall biosynthesis